MTKYTIEIESPRLEEMMLKTFERMEVENQVHCTYETNRITLSRNGKLGNGKDSNGLKKREYDKMILPGPPMTEEEFWEEMEEAQKENENGITMTTDELRQNYGKWKTIR